MEEQEFTQEDFDRRMDELTDVMLYMYKRLEHLNTEEFSVPISVFRFAIFNALEDGWTEEDLLDHFKHECQMTKEINQEYAMSLN